MTNKILLDTNIFLRLLIPEDKNLHLKARKLIDEIKIRGRKAYVPQIVIFEIHFALTKFYDFKKQKVADFLEAVLLMGYLNVESRKYFVEAIKIYRENNVGFPDCFLVATSLLDDSELITLDNKLERLYKFLIKK
ncbi:PIN domain-containing protein [Patescibacteria group bacterium]|nr:PIN domain-containing protein [Patescibacteria group bacterium]